MVEAAEEVARAACSRLRAGDDIIIDFSGVRGVSSSYFNVIFMEIVREVGAPSLGARVQLVYHSNAMRMLAERSLQAVLASS